MPLEPWLYALLVLGVGFHALAALYAYASGPVSGDDAEPADRPERTRRETAVTCPECGTANERGYRFCGSCVAELPGGSAAASGTAPALGRNAL